MATIDLKQLVGRLNDPCRRALEAAAGLTLSRTHYNVEIEHWLLKLLDAPTATSPPSCAITRSTRAAVATDLNRALDTLKTGNARAPSLSPGYRRPGQAGLAVASLEQRRCRGSAPATCCGRCWPTRRWRARAREARGQLLQISADALKRDFAAITAGSAEAADAPRLRRGRRRGRRRRADGAARLAARSTNSRST